MKPIPSIKFALYVRASTKEQQNTLVAQQNAAHQYCIYKEMQAASEQQRAARLPEEYIFGPFIDSGISGEKEFFERAGVGEMLDTMQREGITDIVITKLNRGFRNSRDCQNTLHTLKGRGIEIHVLDQQLDTNTPQGKFFMLVSAGIAELDNDLRKIAVSESNVVARKTGQNLGNLPYGWDDPNPAGTPKQLRRPFTVNAFQQRVLARLVWGDLSKLTVREAQRALNAEKIPSPGAGKTFRRTDKATGKTEEWTSDGAWSAGSVQSVQKNPRLAPGYESPGSGIIPVDLAA